MSYQVYKVHKVCKVKIELILNLKLSHSKFIQNYKFINLKFLALQTL